jgi:bacillithiol biosynthesis cysteine-adding enzyme BshC
MEPTVAEYSCKAHVGRTFTSSFLAGDAAARALLARDFRDPAARTASARAAAARRVHPDVLAVLREQQARLPASAARDEHLRALTAGDTAVVVTGQQVGLFLGPLYTFYKAASTVAMARALTAESGVRCVPLFWLQTEDHDFAEIAACHVADEHGAPVTLELAAERPEEARVSVAHRRLGPEVDGAVAALEAALEGAPGAAEVTALVRAHYVAGRPLAEAFAGLLAAIFADEGLLVLDPREARVARAAAPIYTRALGRAAPIEAGLRARGAALAAAGLDEQIPVRERCTLLCLHPRGADGPRFRLRRDGPCWGLSGGGTQAFLDAEVDQWLREDPLRFSTSALLRPPVQDTVLPVAAYVGGPAEVSYFAQLGPVYDELGVPQPLIAPRARFRVVDAATRRRLAQLGLTAADAERPRDELLARAATAVGTGPRPDDLRRRVAEIVPAVEGVARDIAGADRGLERDATRAVQSVRHVLDRLVGRYARDLAARDTATTERLDKVLRALAPEGTPQERYYSWPSLAARLGAAAFKALVLARLAETPFPTAPLELAP